MLCGVAYEIHVRLRLPEQLVRYWREAARRQGMPFEEEVERQCQHAVDRMDVPTPAGIIFVQENPMNLEGPGVTQVWTGVLSPTGSAFPSGTTFTATPSDPTVTATLDPTGLVLTIAYPSTFVPGATPFSVAWATSTFTPSPASSPASLSATITPTAPPPPVLTPISIAFAQTS